jgi:hypothetical protein
MTNEKKAESKRPATKIDRAAALPRNALAIWKAPNGEHPPVFLGTDEDYVVASLGLPRDQIDLFYRPEIRDGIAGITLTGVAKK